MADNSSFWRAGVRDTLVRWFTPKNAFFLSCLSWLSAVWDFLSKAGASIFGAISGIFNGGCVSLNPFAELVSHTFSGHVNIHFLTSLREWVVSAGGLTNAGAYIWTTIGVPWWVNAVSLYVSLYIMLCILGWCYRGLRWLIGLVMDSLPIV